MTGLVKKLQFSEGTNVTAPTDLAINSAYAPALPNDAAYVSAYGTPQDGSIYINTTTNKLRVYLSAAWFYPDLQHEQALAVNKTIATGYSLVTAYQTINTGVTVTVATGAVWGVLDNLDIDGDLVIDGDVIIF